MDIVKYSGGSYRRLIGTKYPGLIMILLDQSESMASSNKASLAATAVNSVIYEIELASRAGEQILDRCFVGVVGYGASIDPVVGDSISRLAANPTRNEILAKKVSDGAGGLVEINVEMPVWVEPKAKNGTPMTQAIQKAHSLIQAWINTNPESFPPIVINITDGAPNDFDNSSGDAPHTKAAAIDLMRLETTDGKLLLFNAHISGSTSSVEIQLPHSDLGIQNKYAKLLFNISSILPDRLIEQAQKVGLSPQSGARGFVFNAGADTLIKLLTFGSSVAR